MRLRNVFAYPNFSVRTPLRSVSTMLVTTSTVRATVGAMLVMAAMPANAQIRPSSLSELQAALTAVDMGPDNAQTTRDSGDQSPQELSSDERLDMLFSELKRTRNEAKARRIAIQINRIWSQSGSATIDLLMQWANAAMLERRYTAALDFLNESIGLDPDYAEAWNRRAAVYFLLNDYARSMYDINKTLELEPRHYGALAGMAEILRARGLKEQAMKAYEKVLRINPMMRDAQKSFMELTEELTDIRT